MLMTFDEPNSHVHCVRPERSNIPLQALTLLNDPVFVECAQALGKRLITEIGAGSASKDLTEQRIRYALALCLAREPTFAELTTLTHLFEELHQNAKANP